MKKEYVLDDLGYFTKKQCEAIKKLMDGKTFMDFEVGYSTHAGNCTLIVKTDHGETWEDVKNFFTWSVLGKISDLIE